MPRYFFNIVDDDRTIVDSQGVELADLDEVRQEAVTSARELMSERRDTLRSGGRNGSISAYSSVKSLSNRNPLRS